MEKSMPTQIDLFSIAKTLWRGRKRVLLWLATASVVGLLIAFSSPLVYTARTVMVPQIQSKSSGLGSLGSLGGLAAMAGINLSNLNAGTEDLSPLVYPEIVRSYSFQKEIMYAPLNWSSVNMPVSLAEYVQKYQKTGLFGRIKKGIFRLPGTVKSWFIKEELPMVAGAGDSLTRITEGEQELWDEMTKTLTLSVDKKNGFITLTAMGPEPLATAQIADKAKNLLQSRITEFRIEKAKQNLDFIEGRFDEKKKEFETAQDRLARFRDGNQGMTSNMVKTEEDRLQSEYQLAFTVYSELAKQLESAKISVKEDTPIFSIIESVIVPVKPSKPRKFMILMVSVLLGGALGVGSVFARKHWREAN
ncbi:MAG: GNVR domain-containing protein [Bacteroidales bacterium]